MTTTWVTFAHRSLKTTSVNPQIMSFLLQTGHPDFRKEGLCTNRPTAWTPPKVLEEWELL